MPASYICFPNKQTAKLLYDTREKYSYGPLGTTRISLVSEEHNYSRLSYSVRNKISKAKRLGITSEILDAKNTHVYTEALLESWKANKLSVNNTKYFSLLQQYAPDNVVFIVSYLDGKVVAGAGLLQFGHTIMESSIFVTPEARDAHIPGGDFLQWSIIQYGISHKYTLLDLNMIGVTFDSELEEKIKNVNYFKTKWEGDTMYGLNITKMNAFMKQVQGLKYIFLGK